MSGSICYEGEMIWFHDGNMSIYRPAASGSGQHTRHFGEESYISALNCLSFNSLTMWHSMFCQLCLPGKLKEL